MADGPMVDAEVALSYAENMVNWVRGLRYLEQTTRFVRDARREIPQLTEQLSRLRQERDATAVSVKEQADAHAALAETRRELGNHEAKVTGLTERARALNAEVEQRGKAIGDLKAEESNLRAKVEGLRKEIADTRSRMTAMLREER